MHTYHTVETSPDAMPSFTRRALMVGAIVAPAASVTAGESILPWLLDEFSDIRQVMDAIDVEISAIYNRPDFPTRPVVTLAELDYRGVYTPVWGRIRFHATSEIDIFFKTFPDSEWFDADRHQRHGANQAAAQKLLIERKAAFDDWRIKTGITVLEIRSDELAGKLLKLENDILDHRCTSHKECADKAAWFDDAFSGLDVPQYLHRLLQSMLPAGAAGEA